MLYKKYHRNYVSRFKKGTKIKFIYPNYHYFVISEVKREPFIEEHDLIKVSNTKPGEENWVVVFPNGEINKNLSVI